jgi:cardiolipin synthase
VTLAVVGVLPMALPLLVVSRDLMIIGAVILSWLLDRPMEIKPLWISKANTFGQIGFIAALLAALAFGWPLGGWASAGQWAVAALTLASLAAYFKRWVTHMSV